MLIDVPKAKVMATFPEGCKYQMFEQEDGSILIVGIKEGQELIGYIYDGNEARKINFECEFSGNETFIVDI